jgi:hypothetical protein
MQTWFNSEPPHRHEQAIPSGPASVAIYQRSYGFGKDYLGSDARSPGPTPYHVDAIDFIARKKCRIFTKFSQWRAAQPIRLRLVAPTLAQTRAALTA